MTKTTFPCPHCSGTGQVELRGSLRRVLDAVCPEAMTAKDIALRLDIPATLRLEDDLEILESLGLVERLDRPTLWRRT